MTAKTIKRPTLGLALLPIVLTLGVLGIQLFYFKDFTPTSRSPSASPSPPRWAGCRAIAGMTWKRARCAWSPSACNR